MYKITYYRIFNDTKCLLQNRDYTNCRYDIIMWRFPKKHGSDDLFVYRNRQTCGNTIEYAPKLYEY